MIKPIIAALTALSLTFATVSPAQAQGISREEAGKLLIGLAAIAALNAALENRKPKPQPPAAQVNNRPDWAPQGHRGNDWSSLQQKEKQKKGHNALPATCLQDVENRFGSQRMFVQRCLERNYRHVDRLPARCAVRVYTNNGPREGFDPLCLRQAGFTSDRRR
ncbi:hypothetical protein [Yoonia sp.]|uniref:hypothetical protein n=1 Tax=Yoonia sp. TaxID=2212373 RepID=UPI0019DE94E6|nr:hypothetical protein [Yoonia sp.]MBE0414310.1 hypothetical protein [Yoonia sp.]